MKKNTNTLAAAIIVVLAALALALSGCGKDEITRPDSPCERCDVVRAQHESRMLRLCQSYGNGKNGVTWKALLDESARIDGDLAAEESRLGCSPTGPVQRPCGPSQVRMVDL